ncbi:Zinc finger protein [Melia azedarach]|uniref:Zinc finger protein n=1 Tax=Melia azedarach TaxID=155640 RepID=A0ACC1XQJ6_MELAZ|nr:Zinc finger protein [Melia azedarach]
MEEGREFKHVCRFCIKSFPCGRSLGGHMRSHMISNSANDGKFAKKKLSSVNNFITKTNTEINGYGLRENPQKSKKIADSVADTSLVYEKFCKESVKGWKTLCGSMMSNSEKERVSNNTSLEDQDSWTSAKLVTESQSDNETATPNRRRRSKRRTRYLATANSSSFSVANDKIGSSSVSEIEIEQEQEEVAMCLMMLSRALGPIPTGIAESSGNNSLFLEAQIEVKDFDGKKKLREKKLETGFVDSENRQFEKRKPEFSASGISGKGSKTEVSLDLFDRKDTVKNSEVELGKNLMKITELNQAQLGSSKNISSKKTTHDSLDPEFYKDSQKRSKFECATCNKIFHSYQALGGHRASHKKIKGCSASKVDSTQNSIETELSPDPTAESKLIKSINTEINSVNHFVLDPDDKVETSCERLKKRHECPICLKVFPSGQALGGHKRSHLVAGTEARNNPTIVVPEIHNFLDLNLPAPDEEESNAHLGLKQWWTSSSSHKHKSLVSLISN